MNFLEPEEWQDLEKLEKEYEELTEELVKQLHQRLRPYFLRRTKGEVLQLPPKVRDLASDVEMCYHNAVSISLERSHRPSIHDSFAERSLSVNSEYARRTRVPYVVLNHACL
jgi:chromodomain-helicase-DNA-binding protein 4